MGEREILQEKLKSPKTGVGVEVADVNHKLFCCSSAAVHLVCRVRAPYGELRLAD